MKLFTLAGLLATLTAICGIIGYQADRGIQLICFAAGVWCISAAMLALVAHLFVKEVKA